MPSTAVDSEAAHSVRSSVRRLAPDTADALSEIGLGKLASLVSALPSSAEQVLRASLEALPEGSLPAALAAASLAARDACADPPMLERALRHADIAMCFGGQDMFDLLHSLVDSIEGRLPSRTERAQLPTQFPLPRNAMLSWPPDRASVSVASTAANGLSVEDFRAEYFRNDTPVVLEGAACAWPAFRAWSSPRTLDDLCGHRTVPVEITRRTLTGPGASDASAQGSIREEFVTMGQLIDSMLATADEPRGDAMYLAQHPLLDYIPRLRRDIVVPPWIKAGGGDPHDVTTNVWFGTTDTGTRLHYDTKENFLTQVVGTKRVVLFAPSETRHLHLASTDDNFSPVDVDDPDLDMHPDFRNARGTSCRLRPGDTLYMPAGTWHWVRAESPSISVNTWF